MSATGPLRQPATATDREPDRRLQAGEAALGGAQDPRAVGAPTGPGRARPGQKHRPRRLASARVGARAPPAAASSHRHPTFRRRTTQRPLGRRFQRRIQARQRSLLLPADGDRSRLPLPADVRGARIHPRGHRHHRLRAALPRARTAIGHPLRQWRSLCQPQRPVQPVQTIRLVAPLGHLASSASGPATPSRTAATNACT